MIYDAIVVGAGPAGLTSAIYLRRANKTVLVLDSNGYGGQVVNTSTIENYPGFTSITGNELAKNMYEQALKLGTEFRFERVIGVSSDKTVTTDKDSYKAKAVIVAVGRTIKSSFDSYLGRGLSYCATCDGNFFKNKDVAVVGDGLEAIEDALYLSNLCNKVYLINKKDSFRGDVDSLNKPNIEVLLNSRVTDVVGDSVIESIVVNERTIPVSGLFIASGSFPNNDMFRNVIDVKENGYFDSSNFPKTKTEGIYIAGDCVDKELRQIATAVSDGAIAATTAMKEMKGE